ncbi:MAG: TolC family protein [Verrucomicrobiae bacterium]|nr:TolC family protein [Verrucomicrobiae bacterium]
MMSRKILTLAMVIGLQSVGVAADWSLNRALEYVREHSPDAKSAMQRMAKAQAQLREARSQLWPRLAAESSYSATDNPPAAFMMLLNQRQLTFDTDFNDPEITDNWGTEVRLDYPIYLGGARQASIDAASRGVDAAKYSLMATQDQLELEVAKAYFEIYRAREVASAAEASVRSQRSNLELARKLVTGKVALLTAVLDLETKVSEAETQLVFAENARDIQLAYFKSLLGIEGAEPFSVAGTLEALSEPTAVRAKTRAEVLALQQRSGQAAAGIEYAKAGKRPTIHAFASGRHDEGIQERDGGSSWIAGVSVRFNIWDAGETEAKIEQARADEAIAREQERRQRLAVELQITTARLAVTAARKRADLGNSAIKSAAESLDLTRKRFEEGLALSTELIDAEVALTKARVHLANARAEEQMALASLRYALGLPISNR